MPQCQPRPQEAESIDIIESGAATAPAGILFLIRGLDEVHVHRRIVSLRIVGEHRQCRIGAPMEIGGRELDFDPFLVVMLGVELLEQRAVIGKRHLKAREVPLHCRTQLGRQACRELLVILVDEPVLIAQGEGIGHPHANVFVGTDHLTGPRLHRGEPAWEPAVQVLDGGDPGGDHLKSGIEGVEIKIDMPGHQPGHEPQLQRHVRRTVLQRGQADMMVTVDEPRQHHLAPRADHRGVGMLCRELGEGADLRDDAVALQYSAVIDLLPMTAISRFGDHGEAADDAGRHFFSPQAMATFSCSAKARSTSSLNSSVSFRRKFTASSAKRSRGRDRSIATMSLIRPGRAVHTTTRSASAIASSM
jgi:hypothetical protein